MKWPFSTRKVKDKIFGNTQNTSFGVQLKEMADARYGATYMLANTEMKKKPSFSIDLMGAFVVDTTAVSDLKNGCKYLLNKTDVGTRIVGGLTNFGNKVGEVKDKIKKMLADFFRSMIDKIKAKYSHALHAMEWITEFGVWCVAEFAGNISSLIPGWGYVQSAADVYGGVRKAILKAKDFISQIWSGHGVKLMGGHPSIIANALARHSAAGFVGGIKDMGIGIAKIGIEAAGDAAGGAGTIVAAVTGVLQRVANLVDYVIQVRRMKSVKKKAEGMWHKELAKRAAKKAVDTAKPNEKAAAVATWEKLRAEQSMIDDHKEFSQWLQGVVITNPIVAALLMSSGFVAHPYRFLQLLHPNARDTNEAEFAKGVHHIETLKKLSASYIGEYTDNYGVKFTSKDALVKARLKEVQTGKSVLNA